MPRELGVRKLTAFPLETEGTYGEAIPLNNCVSLKTTNNYKKIEAWPNKLGFTKENFTKLIDIVKEAGELDKDIKIPYDKLVTNEMIG